MSGNELGNEKEIAREVEAALRDLIEDATVELRHIEHGEALLTAHRAHVEARVAALGLVLDLVRESRLGASSPEATERGGESKSQRVVNE